MKVYMVTDGHYSDYSVRCICSTNKKAIHAKKFYNASNDIEVVEVDKLPDHPAGMFLFSVRMDRDGRCISVGRENGEYKRSDEWRPYGDGATVHFDMWAEDEKHAVKIANERRVMIIASGEWTTNFQAWRKRKAQ